MSIEHSRENLDILLKCLYIDEKEYNTYDEAKKDSLWKIYGFQRAIVDKEFDIIKEELIKVFYIKHMAEFLSEPKKIRKIINLLKKEIVLNDEILLDDTVKRVIVMHDKFKDITKKDGEYGDV
ncbi:MAG: hypothetical protein WCO84_01210 [bacterium]